MSKTRFQETFLDFAEETIKEDEYRGVSIRSTDPYGYWIADGVDGYYTKRELVEQAIDQHLFNKAKEPKKEVVEPAITKKIAKKVV